MAASSSNSEGGKGGKGGELSATTPFLAVTFGGADLKTVYLGSLRGNRIPYFCSPVAGLLMVHW